MRSSGTLLPFALGLFSSVAAMKTSIYIDQIPAYSKLPDCAENKLSAVVRAQASGCGDNQQLTSFSCFCIEQSTMMASIISSAVQENCAARATGTATITTPLPQVSSAIDVFNSYCARSTELAQYQVPATSQVTITAAPSSTSSLASATSTSTSKSNSSSSVPVAAIAAPVVIGVLAIVAVVCLLFWLRRRRAAQRTSLGSDAGEPINHNPPSYTAGNAGGYEHYGQRYELGSHTPAAKEVSGGTAKYRHELEDREAMEPVELDGGGMKGSGEKGDVKGSAVKSSASEWPNEKR